MDETKKNISLHYTADEHTLQFYFWLAQSKALQLQMHLQSSSLLSTLEKIYHGCQHWITQSEVRTLLTQWNLRWKR